MGLGKGLAYFQILLSDNPVLMDPAHFSGLLTLIDDDFKILSCLIPRPENCRHCDRLITAYYLLKL
jgi:hypothetical protein